jgi:hypothetical protein
MHSSTMRPRKLSTEMSVVGRSWWRQLVGGGGGMKCEGGRKSRRTSRASGAQGISVVQEQQKRVCGIRKLEIPDALYHLLLHVVFFTYDYYS